MKLTHQVQTVSDNKMHPVFITENGNVLINPKKEKHGKRNEFLRTLNLYLNSKNLEFNYLYYDFDVNLYACSHTTDNLFDMIQELDIQIVHMKTENRK